MSLSDKIEYYVEIQYLYDDGMPFENVMKEAQKLRETYNVSVLKKAKKMGSQFDMLEKQGYTKFAQIKDGQLLVK